MVCAGVWGCLCVIYWITVCRTRCIRVGSHTSVCLYVYCRLDLCAHLQMAACFCKLDMQPYWWASIRLHTQCTWGSDLIQSSVVVLFKCPLLDCIPKVWIYILYLMQFAACFFLLVFLCLFKTSTTKPTKHGVKKSVPEVGGECM